MWFTRRGLGTGGELVGMGSSGEKDFIRLCPQDFNGD